MPHVWIFMSMFLTVSDPNNQFLVMWSKRELKGSKTIFFFRPLHPCYSRRCVDSKNKNRSTKILPLLSPQNPIIAEPVYWHQKENKATKTINIKTDLGDNKQLLASGSVLVHYDKYKLSFLTADILPYGVASVFSQKSARWHWETNCSLCKNNDIYVTHKQTKFQQLQGSQKFSEPLLSGFTSNRVQTPWNIL